MREATAVAVRAPSRPIFGPPDSPYSGYVLFTCSGLNDRNSVTYVYVHGPAPISVPAPATVVGVPSQGALTSVVAPPHERDERPFELSRCVPERPLPVDLLVP
jgi:hypothetical protein